MLREKFSEFLYRVCKATYGTMLQINEGFRILKCLILFLRSLIFFSSTLSVLCCSFDIFKIYFKQKFQGTEDVSLSINH